MDIDRQWYLVHTKPRQEQLAVENLKRQHYITYLPYINIKRRVRGKCQLTSEPMFSRYLFIKLSRTLDDWGPIRSTRGVTGIVRFGSTPAKVPATLVELIKQKEAEAQLEVGQLESFHVGDGVRIADGIMQGYEGIISEKSNKKRVTVLLHIVGKAAAIEVPVDAIIRVD